MQENTVPFFSAEKVNAGLDLVEPVTRVLASHWYVLGKEVSTFEQEFAAAVGVPHCVSVANGTDAIEIALRMLGIVAGDRVVTTANAGFYSSTAIHAVGAVPEYVDVDAHSLTMSPVRLSEVIGSKPAAIIVTHLYGQLAEIESLCAMARDAGVPVIEDCAQAHGARKRGRSAGSFGDIGCFSFYPTKNLGALGDGGAVVTRSAELAQLGRQLRQYGWSRKYEVARAGGRNSRLDEMQAAILRAKLPHLDRWNEERRSIARRYGAALAKHELVLPVVDDEAYVAHLYVVRAQDRAALAASLDARGVATDIHYPIPDHRQPGYRVSGEVKVPVTEAACDSVISLPCHPGLTEEQVGRVIEAVDEHYAGKAGRC